MQGRRHHCKSGYKAMLRAEQAEILFVRTPIMTFWGTLVVNNARNRIYIQVLEPNLLRCTLYPTGLQKWGIVPMTAGNPPTKVG